MLGTTPIIHLFNDFLAFSQEPAQLRQNAANKQPHKPPHWRSSFQIWDFK